MEISEVPSPRRFNKVNVIGLKPSTWPRYQKKVPTSALRVIEPFEVETSEGLLTCKDGYLCMDARGYPYPVAKGEFDLIYKSEREDEVSIFDRVQTLEAQVFVLQSLHGPGGLTNGK